MKSKSFFFLLVCFTMVCTFFLRNDSSSVFAEEILRASTVEDLNVVLGGNHKIQGHTLVLQTDIVLKNQYIRLENTEYRITIDANGKSINGKATKRRFSFSGYLIVLHNAELCLRGNGIFQSDATEGDLIIVGETSHLLVESGTFISKKKIRAIRGGFTEKNEFSTLEIKGGDFGSNSIYAVECVPLRVTVSGGNLGKVEIDDSRWYSGNSDDPYYGGYPHEFEMTGGSVRKLIVDYGVGKVVLNGGTIGSGGISGMYSNNVTIKNGTVQGKIDLSGTLIIKGGHLSQVKFSGSFIMTGGEISSSKKVALDLMIGEGKKSRISGGTIRSAAKGGIGVLVGLRKITITGGKIVNDNHDGKAGIFAKGLTVSDELAPKVVFLGTKIKDVVSGFKMPTDKNGKGRVIEK